MAEPIRFRARSRDGSAVNGDERGSRPIAVLVDGTSDEFFAGAGFTADEHIDGFGCDAADFFVDDCIARLFR